MPVDFYESPKGALSGPSPLAGNVTSYTGIDKVINAEYVLACEIGGASLCSPYSEYLTDTSCGGSSSGVVLAHLTPP
jgi:hypothetical protein